MEIPGSDEKTTLSLALCTESADDAYNSSHSQINSVTKSVNNVSLLTKDSLPSNSSRGESYPSTKKIEMNNTITDKSMSLKIAMLERIVNSDAHFKHQQRGEPDLTYEEKLDIVKDVLNKNPVIFLSRFGRYLIEEDLDFFRDLSDQYEINFYLTDIRRFLNDKKSEMKKRNRRFEAMKKMMTEDDYFSAESMKERDPLLYEQLIGQYMTEEEAQEQAENSDLSVSAVLMQHVQSIANSELYNKLCDIEDCQMEEEESEDEEQPTEDDETDGQTERQISPLEKQMLKNEFLRTMQLRFLNGEDKNFNYKEVDDNVDYDSLDIREQDEEEKYFDQSDSESVLSNDMESQDIHSSCNSPSLSKIVINKDTEDEVDYEQYVVENDVCPGLNCDKPNTDSYTPCKHYSDESDCEVMDDNLHKVNNEGDQEKLSCLQWGEYGSDNEPNR